MFWGVSMGYRNCRLEGGDAMKKDCKASEQEIKEKMKKRKL